MELGDAFGAEVEAFFAFAADPKAFGGVGLLVSEGGDWLLVVVVVVLAFGFVCGCSC